MTRSAGETPWIVVQGGMLGPGAPVFPHPQVQVEEE